MLRVLENECEGVEDQVGSEPDVLRALRFDGRAEVAEPPDEAVGAVRADHEVGLRQRFHLGPEDELDAELPAARLEDLKQPPPCDCRERMAPRAQNAVLVADVDPVPPRERLGDLEMSLGTGAAERAERLLAEDDAPAEGRVRRVPLQRPDLRLAVELLEQDPEIEAGRASPDDLAPHPTASARRSSSSIAGVGEE